MVLAAFGVTVDRFDPWVLDRLTDLLDEQYVRAGDVLWSAGEPLPWLYFMREGRVRATREGAPPWTFEGRWLLGSFEGHRDRPASRTLTALTDFYAFRVPRSAWFDLLEDSFDVTRRAVNGAATAVARLDQRLTAPASVPPSASPGAGGTAGPGRSMTTIERLGFLTELGVGRGAGVQVLAELAALSEERVLREGEELFRSEADRDRFFVVVEGQVEATRRHPDLVRRYGRTQVVTGAAALSDDRREWSAHARTPARVLGIPLEGWFDQMEVHFDLALSTLAVMAELRERILEQLAAEAGPEGLVLT
jgi:CRP-like cAMP-binding protein